MSDGVLLSCLTSSIDRILVSIITILRQVDDDVTEQKFRKTFQKYLNPPRRTKAVVTRVVSKNVLWFTILLIATAVLVAKMSR